MLKKHKTVTIIIPCRNEEKYIGKVLDNIVSQDYPKKYLEVFVVDGLSDDDTAKIIQAYSSKYKFIKYFENPNRTVPHALNFGIRESNSEVIIRMDAHAEYPENYVSSLVHYLYSLNADNVGGVWINQPGAETIIAEAIALVLSGKFGIGNADYRLDVKEIKQADTVPFGCFRKELFNKIGFFDEELIRNQDDEFNGRIIKNGGKIFLVPEIKIKYFARAKIKKIIKTFYQYGLFKPLVLFKLGRPATIRQFIPVFFVLLILTLPFFLFINSIFFVIALSVFLIYWMANFFFSIMLSIEKKRLKLLLVLPLIFFLVHISYGYGYIAGIFRFLVLRKRKTALNLSR